MVARPRAVPFLQFKSRNADHSSDITIGGSHAMPSSTMLEDFEAVEMQAEETRIFLRRFGSGPAVLLLHGFPQTHLMWRSSGAFAGSALHGRTPIG